MAAGNQKPKPDAPVHPWDLPPEPVDGEEFEDAGPRTIIAREPGPPAPKKGEVLESMMPDPDPMGGPATLPGNAPTTLPGNTPEPLAPPPLTAFDAPADGPVFDPPTFADRPSAKIPQVGLIATEPNPVPVTASERLPEGTEPRAPIPAGPPPRKSGPSTEAQTVGTPIRKATGDLAKSAEAVRKQTPSGSSAPRRTTGEIKSAEAVRKSTGDIKSAEAVRKSTGDIKSAPAVRKISGEIKSGEQVRKATSKPSGRLPKLADAEDTTRKKLGDQETMIFMEAEKPPPPVLGLGDDEPDDPEGDLATHERTAIKKAGAFSRAQNEKDPTAPSANLGDPDLYERTKTGVKVMDPRAKKRLRAILGLAAVLVCAFLFYSLYQGARERPTMEDLHNCYPYGFEGLRGPHGEDAPGAEFMRFDYVEDVACTTHPVCVRYRYSGQNRFTGTMVLGKNGAGIWERVSDEGCPFPPPRPRE